MDPDELSRRWVDALTALRAEHLGRLHAFTGRIAFAVLALAVAIAFGVLLALDPLWDLSLADSDLGWPLAGAAALSFLCAGALTALALRQRRRESAAAISALDRAIAQLLSGADPRDVLGELSERMRRISPPRVDPGSAPHLPSRLESRSLGTSVYTKMWLAVGLVLLASLLLAQALVDSVPPTGDEVDDDEPSAKTSQERRAECASFVVEYRLGQDRAVPPRRQRAALRPRRGDLPRRRARRPDVRSGRGRGRDPLRRAADRAHRRRRRDR